MAHSLHGQEVVISKKIKDQLTCPICLDPYEDPRTLPCLHSFCAGCLEQLPQKAVVLDNKTKHQLSCPTCRNVTDLPPQGVEGFHKAYHLNNLMEVHEIMKKASGKESTICESCKKDSATVYCRDCGKFFCQLCNKIHKKWPLTASHKVISTREAYKTASKIVPAKPAADSELKCPTHDKPLDLYCVTCEEPICYHCTIKSHKGHAHDLIVDVYEECKTEVESRLESLESRLKETGKKKLKMEKGKTRLLETFDFLKASINEQFDQLVQSIQTARSVRLQSIDMVFKSLETFEGLQVETIQKCLDLLQSCKEHTKGNLDNSTPTQLLLAKKQILARIEALATSEECDLVQPANNLLQSLTASFQKEDYSEILRVASNRISKIGIGCQYPKQLYQHCEIALAKEIVIIQAKKKSVASAVFVILVKTHPLLVDKDDIVCYLENEHAGTIECEVQYFLKDETIKYQLSFTAKESGNYNLRLTIAGESICCKVPLKIRYTR